MNSVLAYSNNTTRNADGGVMIADDEIKAEQRHFSRIRRCMFLSLFLFCTLGLLYVYARPRARLRIPMITFQGKTYSPKLKIAELFGTDPS